MGVFNRVVLQSTKFQFSQRLIVQPLKNLSTSGALKRSNRPGVAGEVHPGYLKIRKQMERFQVEDNVPIHLKAGARDRILVTCTYLLTAFGVGLTFYEIWGLMHPEKKD